MRRTPVLALALLGACGGNDRAPAGEALGAPVEIAAPAAPGSTAPNLTAGADGRVYLSWTEPRPDSAHALRFALLENGRWTEPRTVAEGRGWFVNWADFPSILPLGNGGLAAHWLQKSGAGKYAYEVRLVRSRDDGRTWSAPVVPHRDGAAAEHGFVSLWAAGGDSVGVAWLDGRKYAGREEGDPAAETAVMSTLVAANGGMAPETPLDGRACDCCQTAMTATPDGPLVAYRDRTGAEIRDIYFTRLAGGRWSEPRPVHADGWKIPACPVNGPALSSDGRRVAIAWFTAARDTPRVNVAFSDDAGATWSAPVRVDGGTPAGHADVEIVDDGALVSWIERAQGGPAQVRVRRVSRGGALGEPRVLGGVPERSVPRMARDGDAVVFAWIAPEQPSRVHTARMPLTEAR
ncbi:MAG TPA: sialidase family protein [Longimicrobium sp.]